MDVAKKNIKQQKTINNECILKYEEMHKELFSVNSENTYKTAWYKTTTDNRIDYCQAWFYKTENFIVLRSYETFIAFIDKRSGVIYDCLRYIYHYTNTSAKHYSKFRNRFSNYIKAEKRFIDC